ncbi:hypothetical protein A5M85_04645 [Cellulophaga lytica]|uniref:hypothetical protein n=1 Tax=Cellulophaga lytica TaxID=979 RepID=UPI000950A839|nr:hypothetical protein [Cellulophaga lytica]APU09597.1 hypothetical protein A5M85_04645 [Cellulophaga lytica]
MNLEDFFPEHKTQEIYTELKKYSSKDKEYIKFIYLNNFKLKLKYYIEFEKNISELELNLSTDSAVHNLRLLELKLNKEFIDRLIPKEHNINKISLTLYELGQKVAINELVIKSHINYGSINLDCNLNKIKTSKIILNGKYENILIGDSAISNLNIECDADEITLKNIKPNSIIGGAEFISIIDSKSKKLTISDTKDLNKIKILQSKIENILISTSTINKLNILDLSCNKITIDNNNLKVLEILKVCQTTEGLFKISNNTITSYFKLKGIKFIHHNKIIAWLRKSQQQKTSSILYTKNEIEKIQLENIEWSYDNIIEDIDNIEEKRNFIIKVKSFYSNNQDIVNEKLFKSFEKIWYYKNRKASFPLFLSYNSNKFGLSISRPFILIIACILTQFTLIFYFANSECQNILWNKFSVFIHVLNPTHKTSVFTNVISQCNSSDSFYNFVTIIDNIFRLIITYFIFQFISAYRYTYNLGR